MVSQMCLSQAIGQAIYAGLHQYALQNGPAICQTEDKSMLEWTERDKQTIFEGDLESNYLILRDVLMQMLRHGENLPQFHFEA